MADELRYGVQRYQMGEWRAFFPVHRLKTEDDHAYRERAASVALAYGSAEHPTRISNQAGVVAWTWGDELESNEPVEIVTGRGGE